MPHTDDGFLTPDEKKLCKILSYIDDNRKSSTTTTGYDLLSNFGKEVFQLLHRLSEKGFASYDQNKQCYYIKDAGIEALATTYNQEYRKKQQQKEAEKEKHQRDTALWVKIGVIGSIILSVIALLKSSISP